MFGIKLNKWQWMFVVLVFANIAYYFCSGWGFITVKVTDAPLSKVIRSIEWQGWVKIYTNLPPDTKVTMYADHVSLAEAMETLAANVDLPPPPDGGDGVPPNQDRPARSGDLAGVPPGAGGPPGGPRGGRGGGLGGGRSAQWNLAFFVAPTSAQVKQEIRDFEISSPDDGNKVYTYGTQMQLVATDSTTTAPDPLLQAWPGVKPVDKSASPTPTPPAAPVDAQASAATPTQTGNDPVDPPATPTVQTYLQAFAESANIWVMAPGSWTPEVSSPPPPNPSIITALKNLVSRSHGAVTQALVLRAGRGGARGGNPGGFAGGDDAWADRMRNTINGLPPDQRPDALEQLTQEVEFRKNLQSVPPEQRRQKMTQHMMEKMLYGERLSRLSPAKRALVYQRMIALRTAAKAQK